jgi:hypothetical protein
VPTSWHPGQWRRIVPPLAEIQSLFSQGILTGEVSRLLPLLAGGRYPAKRFAIHQRHYESSLVMALLGKFPATAWLAGTRLVSEAASCFVHDCPPKAPCIAEYGREFPKFLSDRAGAVRLPYLLDFAELEWHVGHLAIAVDASAVSMEQLSVISPDALPDTVLILQPGVFYLEAAWPVDELMQLYLRESVPDYFSMDLFDVRLELRGARGEFHINRLDFASFVFRNSILGGCSIGDAAERALEIDPELDLGRCLAAVIADELVTAIRRK